MFLLIFKISSFFGSHKTVSDLFCLWGRQICIRDIQLLDVLEIGENFANSFCVNLGDWVSTHVKNQKLRVWLQDLIEVVCGGMTETFVEFEFFKTFTLLFHVVHALVQELEKVGRD